MPAWLVVLLAFLGKTHFNDVILLHVANGYTFRIAASSEFV